MSPSSIRRALPVALILLAPLACSTAPSIPPRPWSASVRRPVVMDVQHYDIDVTIDHRARHVQGEVAITLAAPADGALAEVTLDAVELNIARVWNDAGADLSFEVKPETLTITLAEALGPGERTTLHLAWDAFPRMGLYFEGPSTSDPTRPWHVWSMGQSHEARHWLPCWDQPTDRASSTLTLTVDDGFTTLAAGRQVSSEAMTSAGLRTDTWDMQPDHASYLMTIVVGELEHRDLAGPLPLPVVARARDLDDALYATRRTADMISFMGEVTGRPYPFSKYAQAFVDNFTAGGMENISATTMYDEGIHRETDEPQIDITGLVAHELAHQWFGDLVTCDGWGELWLNEGWADWLEARYLGELRGDEFMREHFLGAQHGGCAAEDRRSRPVVWNEYEDPDQMFDGHSYAGSAARIELLASMLGEDVFLRGVAAHVERHANQLVTTGDLRGVFEEVSGEDLGVFFDEWFYGVGYPVIEGRVGNDGRSLSVTQTQGELGWRDVFHIDVSVSWSRGGVEQRGVVTFADNPETTLELGGDGELEWVRLDPDTVIPGKRLMHQSEEAWARQLQGASDGVTRLIAARWFDGDRWTRAETLQGPPADEALAALMHAARQDSNPSVRRWAVDALDRAETEAVAMTLLDLVGDDDTRVDAEAVRVLGELLDVEALAEVRADLLTAVRAATSSDNPAVVAAAVTALVDAERPEAWSLVQRHAAFDDGTNIRLARDMTSLAARLDEPDVVPFLIAKLRTHPERWVRAAAVSALGRVFARGVGDEDHAEQPHQDVILRELLAALHDESQSVRSRAVRTLGRIDDERILRHLRARLDIERSPGVMGAIEAVLDAS